MDFQEKYLNPLTDFGFKRLFGTELNKDLLIDFLNQLLPEKHQIESLTYTNSAQLGWSEIDRLAIFDLYCESKSGEKFIVELQKVKQTYFKDRSIYYSTFPIQEQAKKGDWNYKLEAVYTVGILNFTFDTDEIDQNFVQHIQLKNQDNRVFYPKLMYIYVELPKFTKIETELETRFEKWLYVFRHLAGLQNRPKALQEKIFEKLFKAAEIAKFNRKERMQYEDSLKRHRDLQNVIRTTLLEGMKEGIEKGMEKGMEKGLEKGRHLEKVEMAKTFLKDGLPIETIMRYTGLSKEEIQKIESGE